MTDLEQIYSEIFSIIETFRYVELNAQILSRYANPNKVNIDNLKDLEIYYTSPETQNVFEMISDDLMESIDNLRDKLINLRDSFFVDNSEMTEINDVKNMLNKLLDEEGKI